MDTMCPQVVLGVINGTYYYEGENCQTGEVAFAVYGSLVPLGIDCSDCYHPLPISNFTAKSGAATSVQPMDSALFFLGDVCLTKYLTATEKFRAKPGVVAVDAGFARYKEKGKEFCCRLLTVLHKASGLAAFIGQQMESADYVDAKPFKIVRKFKDGSGGSAGFRRHVIRQQAGKLLLGPEFYVLTVDGCS